MQNLAGANGAFSSARSATPWYRTPAFTYLLFAAMVAFMMVLPSLAHAQTMDLPWDSATCKLAKAFTGPWLGWVAVISIAIAGVAWGIGESKAPLQGAMRIAAGFSIAVAGASVAGWALPSLSAGLSSTLC